MLYSAKTLKGYRLDSIDGEIGKAKSFIFDDQYWAIRYVIADTGNWLTGRKVLLSPHNVGPVEAEKEQIRVELTKKQIEDSPPLTGSGPVSREYEESYYEFYGLPVYWSGSHMWGNFPYVVQNPASWERKEISGARAFHLRDTEDIIGRQIKATDGDMGHVKDFIMDDESWAIRYLVVDTGSWLPGRKVLVSPHWVDEASWNDAAVYVNIGRAAIKEAPEYHSDTKITREYEAALHRHYERRGYWEAEPSPARR